MLGGRDVEGRRGLRAGEGDVVLTGEVHLPDHLRLQLAVAHAAVAQAFPLPSLSGVAVFAHPEPVGRSPDSANSDPLARLTQRRGYDSASQRIKNTSPGVFPSRFIHRDRRSNRKHTKRSVKSHAGRR